MKEPNRLKRIDLAFWMSLSALVLSLILGFVSGAFAAQDNINLTYLFLILGYFFVLLFYVGILIGLVAIGEILKNKLILYLAYVSGFGLIFYAAFSLGSIYFYWEIQAFPPFIYIPLIFRVLYILALIVLSISLFILRHRLGIFASLSFMFLILGSLTSLFGLFFLQSLLFLASLIEFLA
ncbi:MAG: hypothetical protein QW602_01285 [Candidatus Aenigmatarchaeota archaeon]